MKIGTLTFDIYGELLFIRSVETFISSMDQTILTVCDDFDSDYRRFAFYAAVIKIVIPLKIFWKNDNLYKKLVSELNKCFNNWTLKTTLTTFEEGD